MKKCLLVVVAAIALGVSALGGPFLGGSIVPSGSVARPYLTLGWDSGSWIMTTLGFTNPLQVNGWYWIEVSPLYSLTPSWRLGGSLSFWLEMCSWQFTDSRWAAGVTGIFKWRGVILQVTLNLPMDEILPDRPLFGGWVVFSFKYDFYPCCISPVPLCPELGAGCP